MSTRKYLDETGTQKLADYIKSPPAASVINVLNSDFAVSFTITSASSYTSTDTCWYVKLSPNTDISYKAFESIVGGRDFTIQGDIVLNSSNIFYYVNQIALIATPSYAALTLIYDIDTFHITSGILSGVLYSDYEFNVGDEITFNFGSEGWVDYLACILDYYTEDETDEAIAAAAEAAEEDEVLALFGWSSGSEKSDSEEEEEE